MAKTKTYQRDLARDRSPTRNNRGQSVAQPAAKVEDNDNIVFPEQFQPAALALPLELGESSYSESANSDQGNEEVEANSEEQDDKVYLVRKQVLQDAILIHEEQKIFRSSAGAHAWARSWVGDCFGRKVAHDLDLATKEQHYGDVKCKLTGRNYWVSIDWKRRTLWD